MKIDRVKDMVVIESETANEADCVVFVETGGKINVRLPLSKNLVEKAAVSL